MIGIRDSKNHWDIRFSFGFYDGFMTSLNGDWWHESHSIAFDGDLDADDEESDILHH